MSDIKKWQAVSILWEDAITFHGAFSSRDYVKNYEPVMRITIGFLIGKSERHIHVSSTDDRRSMEHCDSDEITTIPMSMVKSVTVLVPQETPAPGPLNTQ